MVRGHTQTTSEEVVTEGSFRLEARLAVEGDVRYGP